jgi:hypothetical protein
MQHIVTDTTEERIKLKELIERSPEARKAVEKLDKKFEARKKKRLAREARRAATEARVAKRQQKKVRYGESS